MRKPPSGTNTTRASYTPSNFGDKFEGLMTLRYALAHSKNIPAVKVAEMVGYDKVADVARAVGLNHDIQPTPSIALGSYEVTPLEIASAYTVFPNGGDLLKNGFIKAIRDGNGATAFQAKPERKPAIDPRVAYLVESMMEDVLRGTGTGARARYMGFMLPAAGKTGTSRDGWFAGFTSKIICVVWVGFDDNRDFKLEGAHSALPIWVEFMKRAHQHAGIQERAFLPAAGRHRHRRYRRGDRRAGRAELSHRCAARCSSPGASRCRSATFTAAAGLWFPAGIRCSSRPRPPRARGRTGEPQRSGGGAEYATGAGRSGLGQLPEAFRLPRSPASSRSRSQRRKDSSDG